MSQQHTSGKVVILLFATVLIVGGYLLMHIRYDNHQSHYFDPFMQAYPDKFEVSESKDSNEFRILALGGSTTKDARIKLEENYPAQLQLRLQKEYPNKKITVLNAGKDWYTTRHSMINYTGYGTWFDPDLVIVMHAINDLYRSFNPEKYARFDYDELYSHFYGASINGAEPVSFDRMLIKKINLAMGKDEKRHFIPENRSLMEYVSISSFEKNLANLVHYIQSDSAECIVVRQPSLLNDTMVMPEKYRIGFGHEFCNVKKADGKTYFPTYQSLFRAMEMFNNSTYEVAQTADIPCVPADGKIPKDLDHFTDDVHYTPKGAALLADLIAASIIDNHYIPSKFGH